MDTFNAGWFVVYTKPRHEKRIATQLESINVNNYLPLVKRLRSWSDRRKYVDTPLFPSYLFVRLNDVQSYFKSLEIEGVLYYVRTGRQIAKVSESTVENLKLIVSNASEDIIVSSENIYPGKTFHIKEGPFTGFYCEVIKYEGKQKILVRVELLQRNLLLDLPVSSVFSSVPEPVN